MITISAQKKTSSHELFGLGLVIAVISIATASILLHVPRQLVLSAISVLGMVSAPFGWSRFALGIKRRSYYFEDASTRLARLLMLFRAVVQFSMMASFVVWILEVINWGADSRLAQLVFPLFTEIIRAPEATYCVAYVCLVITLYLDWYINRRLSSIMEKLDASVES